MTIAMNRGQAPGVRMPLALIAIGLLAILGVLVYGIVSSVTDEDSPRRSYSPPVAVESDTGAVLTWAEDLSRAGVAVSGLSPASVSFDGTPTAIDPGSTAPRVTSGDSGPVQPASGPR